MMKHQDIEQYAAHALQALLTGHAPPEEDVQLLTGDLKACIVALTEALSTEGIQGVRKAFTALVHDRPWLNALATTPTNVDRNLYRLYQYLILYEPTDAAPHFDSYGPFGLWDDVPQEMYMTWKRYGGIAGLKVWRDRIETKQHKTERDKQLIMLLCGEEPQEPEAQDHGKRRQGKGLQIAPKEIGTNQVLSFLGENEYGDARLFALAFAGQVCYDSTGKEWYLWAGHFWQRDTTGQIRQLVSGELAALYLHTVADLNAQHASIELKQRELQRDGVKEDNPQLATLKDEYKTIGTQMQALRDRAWTLRGSKRCKNVLEYIQVEMGISSDQWDTNQWALATPNGVIDLHTGACRDGQPTDYIRTTCPTTWTGLHTPCPRFERFLSEVFEDKSDRDLLIAFLQRLLGYGITGSTADHIFPVFYGEEGRNGKDTLLGTLEAVLGPLVGVVSNDVFVSQDKHRSGGAATPHLTDLQGKRLVWGSETKQGDKLNIAQIKLLTGGGAISARPLYGKQFTFTPTHKLLLMTNYKPHADARDKAFWSRACLLEFSIRFVDTPQTPNERPADHHLKAALKQERSGILAWLVRGCLDWQREGLNIPSSILLATQRYQAEEDQLSLFIEECCILAEHATVGGSELYTAYKDWCAHNRLSMMTGTMFGLTVKKRFPRKEGEERRTYLGIGLRTTE